MNSESKTQIHLSPRPWKESIETRPSRTPVLVVLHGEQLGKRFLLNEPRLHLGRSPERSQILIPDPSVSGRHCRFDQDLEQGRTLLTDVGSSNGTFVNRVPIHSVALDDGDKIFLGDTILKFTFQDELEDRFHREMDDLINIDDLTGLLVKRSFDIELNRSFSLAQKSREPLCVVMTDMDGLKALNDHHGHQMGSRCIAIVGKLIREIMSEEHGVACRFGGDEFLAYLPNKTLAQAVEICERIRRSVEAQKYGEGLYRNPTMSIGVAERTESTRGPEALVRQADDALYRAKESGRNCVES